MNYFKLFIIYSFIGFIFENIVYTFSSKKGKSGILYGPITPIYGIGAIIITLMYNQLYFINNANLKVIILMILSFIILTFCEYIGGVIIEKKFKIVYWDYSNKPFSYNHYICLEASIIWSLSSIMVAYVLNPLINSFEFPNYINIILMLLLIIDILYTFVFKNG